MTTTVSNEIQKSLEIFEKYGIKARLNESGSIIISHYNQPKEKTFCELGIDEDKLIENVVACEGMFDTRKSKLTTFPLIVCGKIAMYEDTLIKEMPNLKVVGYLVANSKLKKLPKLKTAGSISLDNSSIKSLPKLQEVGIMIVQNSQLKELPSLKTAMKLCIIDSPISDLSLLEKAEDVFICSSDVNNKIDIKTLPQLQEVKQMFVANTELKTLPKLKTAQKLSFSNCKINSVKKSINAEFEINKEITDEELAEKFDSFTDWYNSDAFQKAMDVIGNVVNQAGA